MFSFVLSRPPPRLAQLMTISGFDFYTSMGLKAAIGEISRFESPKKLVSYFGLSTKLYQSAKTSHSGGITKRGRSHARWVMIQAAHNAVKSAGPLRAFFQRIKRRTNRNKALVATANKLTRIVWQMLTNKEPYRYAYSLRVRDKYDKLRVLATGVKRKGGKEKGVPTMYPGKAYSDGRREARQKDYDIAFKEEQAYETLVNNRLGIGTEPAVIDIPIPELIPEKVIVDVALEEPALKS